MTSRDPISSLIGHGQFGLRSGLRMFDTLVKQSRSQKHAFVEIRGGKLAVQADWSVHAGSIYKITTFEVFDGRRLDVVGVRLATSTLTRVEALADVVAGTYYVDPAPTTSTILYARLSDSSNPASSEVLLMFGFYFSSARVVQPALGPEKLTDGSIEEWTNPTTPANWSLTNVGGTGVSFNQDASLHFRGQYSVRLEGSLVPGAFMGINNDALNMPTVPGAYYRLFLYYKEATTNTGGIVAGLGLQGAPGTLNIQADGRSFNASLGQRHPLDRAYGETKCAVFDCVAPDTILKLRLYMLNPVGAGGTGTGKVWFDAMSFRRIYRWELYEGRVAYDQLPAIDEGRTDIFFDRWQTGQGGVSLINGDGYFESLFGSYEVGNGQVFTRLGGRFPDGNEILFGDQYIRRWTARQPSVNDHQANLELDDPRQILYDNLPNQRLNSADWPDIAQNDDGRTSALIYGSDVSPVKAPQVQLVATSLYGTYLLADSRYGAVLPAATAYAYVDENSATKELPLFRTTFEPVTLSAATNLYNGRGAVDLVYVEAGKNDRLDFTEGGGALLGIVAPGAYLRGASGPGAGVYGANTISKVVQDALTLAGGTYVATYVDATHKHNIARSGGGNFEIRLSTGANRARSLWPDLGFTADTDKTGATNYDSDTAMFIDAASEEVVRFITDGYVDNGSGTYTGTPAATIEKSGDITYHMLRAVLGESVDNIDLFSVNAVRSGAAALKVYLGCPAEGDGTHEVGQIFEWLGNSDGVDQLMDGDLWIMRKRDNTVPSNILDLYDSDFLDFEGWYTDDDLASIVRVEFDQNPATGTVQSLTVSDATVGHVLGTDVQLGRLRLGREKTRVFRTYLPDGTSNWINELIFNAMARRRRFKFSVKGSCFRKLPGDKLRINRTDFLGRTTIDSTVVVRILNANHNQQTFVSTLECAEVLQVTYGW